MVFGECSSATSLLRSEEVKENRLRSLFGSKAKRAGARDQASGKTGCQSCCQSASAMVTAVGRD